MMKSHSGGILDLTNSMSEGSPIHATIHHHVHSTVCPLVKNSEVSPCISNDKSQKKTECSSGLKL